MREGGEGLENASTGEVVDSRLKTGHAKMEDF